ncbi:hypothetical protein D3C71_1356120 [compost metagenome]
MKASTPNSISLVPKRVVSLPFTLTTVSMRSRSAPVSIQGPIGLKVSLFLARQNVRSEACQFRSLTSLPIV